MVATFICIQSIMFKIIDTIFIKTNMKLEQYLALPSYTYIRIMNQLLYFVLIIY